MLTVIEQRTCEAICSLATALEKEVPKITGQLNCIVGSLEVMGSSDQKWRPKEDPCYCMSFREWVDRLGFEDRRRLMNFLWNDEGWHDTCLREEDFPFDDRRKTHPNTDDDLPF